MTILAAVITATLITCHPMACEEVVEPQVPEWLTGADTALMAGILQGEVGNIPDAFDFVAEQLVSDAANYHAKGQRLTKLTTRWYAWQAPTQQAVQTIQAAWERWRTGDLRYKRCMYIGTPEDAKRWGINAFNTIAEYKFQCKQWTVLGLNCS